MRYPNADQFPEGLLDYIKVDQSSVLDLDLEAHMFARTEHRLRIMDVDLI